ncbi:MAG TPA: nucleotide exchange factor GrpE, partial [Thermoplasmata archaeon]|nr:nucleotide exchange factor GrpE [Thermoplasmata archaeon]
PAPETAEPPAAPDWETRFKYLFADFENYRKRSDRDRAAIRLRAEADLLAELIPIVEAFEKARESVGHLPTGNPVRRGIEMVGREWDGFLAREGVRPVARPGGRFNSEDHEAVSEDSARPGRPTGSILEVVQQGYRFSGGLLRPAKVVVARARPVEGRESPGAPTGDRVAGSGATE